VSIFILRPSIADSSLKITSHIAIYPFFSSGLLNSNFNASGEFVEMEESSDGLEAVRKRSYANLLRTSKQEAKARELTTMDTGKQYIRLCIFELRG